MHANRITGPGNAGPFTAEDDRIRRRVEEFMATPEGAARVRQIVNERRAGHPLGLDPEQLATVSAPTEGR